LTRPRLHLAWLLALVPLLACSGPDPLKQLEVTDFETYWVVERSVGDTHYIAPAVRVALHHKGDKRLRSVQLQARFNRVGESEEWGSDWKQVQGREGRAIEPDDTAVVTLKPAEGIPGGHYYSTGSPESMLEHADFVDAEVKLFVRVGGRWVELRAARVARRIGSRTVEDFKP
jgi:hypothetical protein